MPAADRTARARRGPRTPGAERARARGVAARHDGLQAARVHGIERDVRAHGGADGGAQLHLVVAAAARHAAAEVEDRLLLFDRGERVGERLDGAQPRVVVEDVVFGAPAGGAAGFVGGGRLGAGVSNATPSTAVKWRAPASRPRDRT
jgi:hypothetical protein